MSGWNKQGIRGKLFSVFLLILAVNFAVLALMGSTLFEKFYQTNKISELEASAKQIRTAYDDNSATFFDEVGQLENENTQVSIFSFNEGGSLESVYHSRANRNDKNWEAPPNLPPIVDFLDYKVIKIQEWEEQIKERLTKADETLKIEQTSSDGRDRSGGGEIVLYTKLNDNLYLYMQTPRGYIKSVADLAVKYTSYLSMAIFLIGAVIVYFVAGRATKPIRKVQAAAERIARMDFSQKCEISGGDEIAMLATSINHMSEELEASIEKLVQANEVLQSDLIRQQQTDQMRREFIANVSHDFKTPLTLMISYAEALSAQESNEENQSFCGIIIEEGNRLSHMVGRLLSLSKLESGVDKIEKSIFCLNEILDGVAGNLRILTEKRGLTVNRCYGGEYIVCADFQKITQVITNLFENAVKYTSEGGKITVTTEQREGCCRVSFENTGNAIAEEDLRNLFDSFYRADKARGASGQSYGLGLAIVRAIMELHQQAFGAENTVDGVRFWFELELMDFEDSEP